MVGSAGVLSVILLLLCLWTLVTLLPSFRGTYHASAIGVGGWWGGRCAQLHAFHFACLPKIYSMPPVYSSSPLVYLLLLSKFVFQ